MDIQAILRDTPSSTSLYSPVCGPCRLVTACSALVPGKPILVQSKKPGNVVFSFTPEGHLAPEGICLLFPSDDIRDWQKFQWKRGDVLAKKEENYSKYCVFDSFTSEDYWSFKGRFVCENDSYKEYWEIEDSLFTEDFCKVSDEDAAIFIESIERKYGGKLNLETLEIEKSEPEFKPFDRVLVRNYNTEKWRLNFFSQREEESDFSYKCLWGNWHQCIPYDGNERLLGTTDKPH